MIGAPRVSEILARVVNASREVGDPEKRVWFEIRRLADIPGHTERCFASPDHLALGLNLSVVTVKKARQVLKRLCLVDSEPRPGERTRSWWPTVPPGFGPVPAGGRLSDDELIRLRDAFDALARAAKRDVPGDASLDQRRPTVEASQRTPQPSNDADSDRTPWGVPQDASPPHDTGVSPDASPVVQGVPTYASTGVPSDAPSGGDKGGDSKSQRVVKRETSKTQREDGGFAHEPAEGERALPEEWYETMDRVAPPSRRRRTQDGQPTPIAELLPAAPSANNGAAPWCVHGEYAQVGLDGQCELCKSLGVSSP